MYVTINEELPASVCNGIDKTVRGFIWGSTSKKRKAHLLAWDVIARPRAEGGLGIRPMQQTNRALMAKLGWRTLQEPNSLWSRVIRGKYCRNRLDIDMFTKLPRASDTWKGLVDGASTLAVGVRTVVGNGQSTLF